MRKLLWTLALGLSGPVLAGDFVDTRLSFVFADDNVFASAGETTPNSPDPRFGADLQNTQFYDNFNTRYSGFETLSNVVLYKETPAFFEGLTTQAAFTVLMLQESGGSIRLRDNSSYIRLAYRPASWGTKESISVTGFPVSSDRFRLGYAYRISWGGNNVFTAQGARNGVPGVKLQVSRDTWYAYAGAKTTLLLNDLIQEQETQYGFLGGAGIDLLPTLRLEAGGGYFQKGLVPRLAAQGLERPVNALGGSAQAVFHVGVPVGVSVDMRLYKNDPDVYQRFFKPEQYPGGLSYLVSLEGSYLVQTLEDPEQFGATTAQDAQAVALQARMKWNYLRAHILGLYRTVSFIQFEVPSFPPFQQFPAGTELEAEMFVAAGFDYHLPRLHLTPGIIFGVQQPASFTSPEGAGTSPLLQGQRTVVVRDINNFSILPSGEPGRLIYSAKATFRWDISETVASIGEVYFTRDPNRVSFRDDITGVAEPTFERPNALGFNILLQARF